MTCPVSYWSTAERTPRTAGIHDRRIGRQAPELPSSRSTFRARQQAGGSGDTLRIADWVNSVVADIDEAGLGDVVVVGHSMGG